MITTEVYDTYWYFAAERHAIYQKRLVDRDGPWTSDPILNAYRFTNSFRAADRVSQYLIREVQYRSDRSQAPAEIFFRTLLFKLFNKIETWEAIEEQLGPLAWQSASLSAINDVLDLNLAKGHRIYSAAYIMPPPNLGHARKHTNHLALLEKMMNDGLAGKIEQSASLESVYDLLKVYPGLGPFLCFQYAIDLNYSNIVDFSEQDFVVAGPGALDGIAKCFTDTKGRSAEQIIAHMVAVQDEEFEKRGLCFDGLFGRKLQPIDCQNVFCEISKYARVAHPEVAGISNRTRIKQSYRPSSREEPTPFFPPRWALTVPEMTPVSTRQRKPVQGQLL